MPEQQTVTYKCPYCDAPLRYIAGGRQLGCASCGNKFAPELLEQYSRFTKKDAPFDWGDYKKSFQQGLRRSEKPVYVCRSCGAALETDETTASLSCPYCDNEIVLSDRLSGGLQPNGVIPFALDRKAAVKTVKDYFKGKKLLPRDFTASHTLSRIKGVYVPFWLFDAGVDGAAAYDCTTVRHYSDSDYDYTETKHYLVRVSGSMRFSGVPVDGSEKADDDLMNAIEPFDYSGVVPFDPGYLAGYLSDRFDSDPDESLPRASERMEGCAAAELRSAVGDGYNSVSFKGSDLRLDSPGVKYVLLPVYLLNVDYGGKSYRFAVNGQTGRTVGELPVSRLKKLGYFWGCASAVAAAVSFLLYLIAR